LVTSEKAGSRLRCCLMNLLRVAIIPADRLNRRKNLLNRLLGLWEVAYERHAAADVLAMTRNSGEGFLEGNGIIILILFFLIFGFGGNGFGKSDALQNSLTRAELYDGLNTQDIKAEIGDLQMQMCNGFSNVNTNILTGVNTLQNGMCNGFNAVNQNLAQLGFNMQQYCCDLKTTMHDEGE